MEVDFVTGDVLDEETLKIDDNNINDDSGFEAERCGICMEIVIDRGVLDCCQHWFCFGCIDNWATIINLCPLCQNEFQLITCVPVYDTIGSNKVDEDSMSRDDDWSVEGKNNTLSFPSYYIDENAVICLDGDGCRIRSGSTTVEEDSDLDTSIACDSCEIWYHAFCVGFDTEGTSEDTWICPRCAVDKVAQKSDVTSTQQPKNKCLESSSSSCLAKDALSGKMSISVADAGETAVVVSMVGGSEWIKGQSEDSEPSLEVDRDVKVEAVSPDNRDVKVEAVSPDDNNLKTETAPGQKMDFQPILGSQGLELSLSYDTSFSPPSDSLVLNGLKASSIDTAMNEPSSTVLNGLKASSIDTAMNEPSSSVLNGLKASSIDTAMNEPSSLDGVRSSLTKLLDHSCAKNLPSECATNIDLHLGLSVGCSLSANQKKNSGTEDDITRDAQLQGSLEEFLSRDEKILFDANEDTVKITGIKRKSDDVLEADDQQASATNEAIAKKSRAEGKFQKTTSQGQPEMLLSDDSQNYATEAEALFDVKLKKCPERDVVTSDIMSIVQETGHGASKGVVCQSPVEQSSRERENAAGLRVKKIMRRVAEDDSSTEVQKLRKEIREAVHNKSKADIGENIFDPKLLAAFRHAVAESTTEIVDKLPPSSLKAKRSMLQKGKTRENLTKKIYGNSNGRRKRAWDRDCEVEFWKHRCMRTTKPEKVATLKSVLNVLKGNLEGSDMQQTSEYRTTDPILSRLYVADTSVFPRKDDIKPLSALSSISNPIKILAQPISTEKGEKSSLEGHTPKSSDSNRVASILGFSTLHDKVVKDKVPSLKGKASSPTAHLARGPEGGIMAPSGGSNLKLHKEASPQSEDKKVDKRKWALEILARKKAVAGNDAKHEKQEDNAMLKGNYPLLAQLPTDMRPVLAPSRHNKIPISVRQTQLFRLTEHFLKKVNLPEIRRTAETELAVADAINIEKEVADKSKSKLVYLNLCSQELFHRSDSSKSVRSMESDPSPQTVAPIDGSEQVSYEIPTDPTVTEALRNAGLLSDSPPGSPYHKMDPPNETENLPMEIKEEGPEEEDHDNILEMDSLPEVDIYGDFDYTLEDEDYIGVTTMEISKLAPEDGESKMKVVFSTLKSENLSHAEGCEEHGRLENVEPKDSTSLPDTRVDGGIASSTLEGTTDKPHVPSESLSDQGDEEPSLAECEELYGPDKELLINKFPEEESTKPYGLVESKAPVGNEVPGKNENFVSGLSDNTTLASAGESSCHGEITSVQVNEKVPRKDNFNTDKQSDVSESVSKKVEAYVKEHIRPLCKSGVITAEQYRWAVAKTTDKVMKYHSNAKNANFLIKEGEKVKKLAEQYVETAQWKEKD